MIHRDLLEDIVIYTLAALVVFAVVAVVTAVIEMYDNTPQYIPTIRIIEGSNAN